MKGKQVRQKNDLYMNMSTFILFPISLSALFLTLTAHCLSVFCYHYCFYFAACFAGESQCRSVLCIHNWKLFSLSLTQKVTSHSWHFHTNTTYSSLPTITHLLLHKQEQETFTHIHCRNHTQTKKGKEMSLSSNSHPFL